MPIHTYYFGMRHPFYEWHETHISNFLYSLLETININFNETGYLLAIGERLSKVLLFLLVQNRIFIKNESHH